MGKKKKSNYTNNNSIRYLIDLYQKANPSVSREHIELAFYNLEKGELLMSEPAIQKWLETKSNKYGGGGSFYMPSSNLPVKGTKITSNIPTNTPLNFGQSLKVGAANAWNNIKTGQANGLVNSAATAIGGLLAGGNESAVGNAMQSIGSLASNIPGVGGLIGAGVNLLGGITNAAFGSNINKEFVNQVENQAAQTGQYTSGASDNASLLADWNNMSLMQTIDKSDVGSDGWFSDKASDETDRLNDLAKEANAKALASITNTAENIDKQNDLMLMANYNAYGGSLNKFDEGGYTNVYEMPFALKVEYSRTGKITNTGYPITPVNKGYNALRALGRFRKAIKREPWDPNGSFTKAVKGYIDDAKNATNSENKKNLLQFSKYLYNLFVGNKGQNLGLSKYESENKKEMKNGGKVNRFDLGGAESKLEEYKKYNLLSKKMKGKPNAFLDKWNEARLATDRFDDLLGGGESGRALLEEQKANRDSAPITKSKMAFKNLDFNRGLNIILKPDESASDYLERYKGLYEIYRNKVEPTLDRPSVGGVYSDFGHTIWYNPDYVESPSFLTHEQAHASKAKKLLEIIKERIARTGKYKDPYLDNEGEIYSRLMQVREDNNIDPNKIWDLESLQEFKKTAIDHQFLNRYDDNTILDIFNNVAYNDPIKNNMILPDNNLFPNMSYDSYLSAFGGPLNKFADGGELFTNGVTTIGNGGTHEENPYEGVQMGVDPQGIPNLVEEGEVIYDDYVFSNRLRVPKEVRQKYKLRGVTFADAAKQLQKESEERPNDPISKNGLNALMQMLMNEQEMIRAKKERNKYANGGHLFDWGGNKLNIYGYDPSYNAGNWFVNNQYTDDYRKRVNDMTLDDWNLHLRDQSNFYNDEKNKGTARYNVIDYMYKSNPWMKDYVATEDDLGKIRELAKTKPGFMHPLEVLQRLLEAEKILAVPTPQEEAKVSKVPPTVPSAVKKDKEGPIKETEPMKTNWLRYAPIAGHAIGAFSDLFSSPDYSFADRIANVDTTPAMVGYTPVGNYLSYKPFDRDYYTNKLNADTAATRRGVVNTSGGNRAAAMAGLLAADYNHGNQLGDLARQAEEYNLAQRQKVEEFNRGTNMANSEMGLKAAMANAESRNQATKLRLSQAAQVAAMRKASKDAYDARRSNNINVLLEELGGLGTENWNRDWLDRLAKSGVLKIDSKGNPVISSAKGGKIRTKKKKGFTYG